MRVLLQLSKLKKLKILPVQTKTNNRKQKNMEMFKSLKNSIPDCFNCKNIFKQTKNTNQTYLSANSAEK